MLPLLENSSVSDAELSFVTRKLHRKYQGHLESPRRRRDRDVIAYPVPECMCRHGKHRSVEALNENGKQPLRWVNLNKEERDDLAMFLSGSSQTSESLNSDNINLRDSSTSSVAEDLRGMNGRRETRCYGDSPDCLIDIDERGSLESGDKKAGTRRRWSSPNVPNISALRINVPVNAKEDERKKFLSQIEDTPKEKGSKPLFWLQRCRDYNQDLDELSSGGGWANMDHNHHYSFSPCNFFHRPKPIFGLEGRQEEEECGVNAYLEHRCKLPLFPMHGEDHLNGGSGDIWKYGQSNDRDCFGRDSCASLELRMN
ncbi:unnamed protein product [Arabidopsis arenosa]|uniref:Uncharacterized protein n=1 Tax=Arabidopsis arenosa TaxID=38785 RepID=A0A8S1ZZG6_ARAAE|nr:unnamed protein product [Arabidopsis arenosa]